MSKLPSVAIVIPAYNEEETIAKCLDACINQTSRPDEIIIVNNKSTDGTVAIVKRYQKENPHLNIRLCNQNKYQGITPTRNRGFDEAESDVIGRIDADTIVQPDWVEAIRRCFQDQNIDAATGPVLYHDMPLQELGFRVDDRIRNTLHRMAKDHRFLFGTNMAIRASSWREVRHLTHLDLENKMHEDIDLALTLFENDYEIAYEPTMVAGMSARRLESGPRDFYRYCMRYERTVKAHNVKSATARLPIFIYLMIYFPIRTVRLFYDGEDSRFTLAKLREELRKIRA
jgi:glycosyltransferase involved in cell wall biosynthesis